MEMIQKLCQKTLENGMMFSYVPGLHYMEVQTKSGLYWARMWESEQGKPCIIVDMNGVMIEGAEPGIMLDLGANVGRYTIPMATKATRVYAFEPDPKNFAELNENTSGRSNIIPIPMAVSNKVGKAQLFTIPRRLQTSMVEELIAREPKTAIEIKTTTVDAFCEGNGVTGITAIKVDVEGMEGAVFEGMAKTLLKESPLIALETHNHADLGTVRNILHACGYTIYGPDGTVLQDLTPDLQVICSKYKK